MKEILILLLILIIILALFKKKEYFNYNKHNFETDKRFEFPWPKNNKTKFVKPINTVPLQVSIIANKGDQNISVNSTNGFQIGNQIKIVSSEGVKEKNVVVGLGNNLLQLNSPLKNNYIPNSLIYNITNPDTKYVPQEMLTQEIIEENPQYCIKWQQTLNCDPDGPIDEGQDGDYKEMTTGEGDCNTPINSGSSGYCICADGSKQNPVSCGHEVFNCNDVCKPYSQKNNDSGGSTYAYIDSNNKLEYSNTQNPWL